MGTSTFDPNLRTTILFSFSSLKKVERPIERSAQAFFMVTHMGNISIEPALPQPGGSVF
jgi:hypothetical protein